MIAVPVTAAARGRQLGALASPGPLSKAHADLEGIRRCQSCHEPGKGVSAARCLSCHEPVARRIAARRGVHRRVTTDCVSCHVEHMGRDAELRPFDVRNFDHARETGYALDGRHAPLARDCAACHKTRSFLAATPACGSCHRDPHEGSLGVSCERCHSTSAAFSAAAARFDHSVTEFALTGAHAGVSCAGCHTTAGYSDLREATCASCHEDPHGRRFGRGCETCHASRTWRTTRVDHGRTRYPLVGRHAVVACVKCHVQPAMKVAPPSERCAACHEDPHAAAFRQDCAACHSERGFAKAPFDHGTTAFPLTGAHEALGCVACHANTRQGRSGAAGAVHFGGLSSTCASCHADVHAGELGAACESCHTTASFAVARYVHRGGGDFFGGRHAAVACERCHAPEMPRQPVRTSASLAVRYRGTPAACASCHADVHLGQVGLSCESCHSTRQPGFAVAGFPHDRTRFRLQGRHQAVACRECHEVETASFPSGAGTAVRLSGLGTSCAACHADVHEGQLTSSCESCHSPATFRIERYTHRAPSMRRFLEGAHAAARCDDCHRPASAPPGTRAGTASYRIDTRCSSCHTDPHRGQLGDRCESCHRVGARQ